MNPKANPSIRIIMMPFFRLNIPLLSVGCLNACLKEEDFELKYSDLRFVKNDIQTFTYIGPDHCFAQDIPDLPLILKLVANFRQGRKLLDGMDDVIKNHIQTRPLSFFKVRADIEDIEKMVSSRIRILTDSDIIGFPTYTTNLFSVVLCSLLIRQYKPDALIVFGGPQVSQSSTSREICLRLGIADVVIVGEGDRTFVEVVRAHKEGQPIDAAGAMTFDQDNDISFQPAKPLDITTLPCPDFDFLSPDNFGYRPLTLPLYASRGCPFSCTFCNEWVMWQKFRQLEAGEVVDRMKRLNRLHGTSRFRLADSLLNASATWLEEFADIQLRQDTGFEWHGYFRADMTADLAKKLKKSGLCRAFIGLESISADQLKRMKKRRTATENVAALENFLENEIPVEVSNIVGFPGESESDVQRSWNYFLKLESRYPSRFILNYEPFQLAPSSEISSNPERFEVSVKPWPAIEKESLPEVSDIVGSTVMSCAFKPTPAEIYKRTNFLHGSVSRDQHSATEFRLATDAAGIRKRLNQCAHEDRIRITGSNLNLQEAEIPGAFLLYKGVRLKNVLTTQEREIFGWLNGSQDLGTLADRLAKQTGSNPGDCARTISTFATTLLDKGVLLTVF